MERKVRIFGKLFLIFLCTACFIWLITKDREGISLRQPKGEKISRQEVMLLMQAFAEAGEQKGALPKEIKICLEEWLRRQREKSSQKEQTFLYGDYIALITVLQSELYSREEQPDFTADYQADFPILKKDWYRGYDALLKAYGLNEIITKEEISILTGNVKLSEENPKEKYLLTDEGEIYRYFLETFEDCFFSVVTAYRKEDSLLTVCERKQDEFTLKNVWLTECTAETISFFYQGFEISCDVGNAVKKEELQREKIADITFGKGSVLKMKIKRERIGGKLLRLDEKELELEGRGIYSLSEDFKGYRLYDTLKEIEKSELRIGYDFTDFVVEDGEICAALVTQKENMEWIRVAVKTTDFASLYHEEIRLTADCDAEISYGAYENRQTKQIKEGEEILFTKDSDYLKGDRAVITPSVRSGKVKVLSVTRNQGIPSYRGKMEIVREKEGLLLINEVLLEEYLYSVVPSEMPAAYPKEALKAQAVCARTYAYRYLFEPGMPSQGVNVDDSVGYQVYNNIAEQGSTTLAVKETTGELLYYQDTPVSTYYYSTSCGFGTDAGVWQIENKEKYPYLISRQIAYEKTKEKEETEIKGQGAEEALLTEKMTEEASFRRHILGVGETDYEKEEPWYRWQYEVKGISGKEVYKKMKSRFQADSSKLLTFIGKDGEWENEKLYEAKKIDEFDKIYEIRCLKRRNGGVMDELLFVTDKGTYKVISEYNIRYILNQGNTVLRQDGSKVSAGQLLPSAYLIIDTVKKGKCVVGYTIFGGGYGHGVGMSQNGARTMGNIGKQYKEILSFFYPGCRTEKCY